MPLEISELFSMAPLARGSYDTEYHIPKNFNLGTGKVKRLQEELVGKFESLERHLNAYLEAEGRSVHCGMGTFAEILYESKKSIRETRTAVVQLMAAIYDMGTEPLPPKKGVDADVARVLCDSCLTVAARAASTTVTSQADSSKFTEASSRSEHKPESSKAVEARYDGKPTARNNAVAATTRGVAMPATRNRPRGNDNSTVCDNALAAECEARTVREVMPATRTKPMIRTKSAIRGNDNSTVCDNALAAECEARTVREVMPATRTKPMIRTKSAAIRGNDNSTVCDNALAAECEARTVREVMPATRTKPMIRTKSAAIRSDGKSTFWGNDVAVESELTNVGEATPARTNPRSKSASRERKSPVAVWSKAPVRSTAQAKSAISGEATAAVATRCKTQARAVAAPRPKLMSRGAAARARAEAAWDARARAEAIERAAIKATDGPTAASAARARTYLSTAGRR